MRWSDTTCERICAIEVYIAQQTQEAADAANSLKEAEKARAESEDSLMGAIREAKAEHEHHWPDAVIKRITSHHEDMEKRAVVVRQIEGKKKRALKEAERATDHLLGLVKEAREDPDLFDRDATAGDANAWRSVMLEDITDEASAQLAAAQNLITVGQLLEAGNTGRLKELIRAKALPGNVVVSISKACIAFCQSRGVEAEARAVVIPGREEAAMLREAEKARAEEEEKAKAEDAKPKEPKGKKSKEEGKGKGEGEGKPEPEPAAAST